MLIGFQTPLSSNINAGMSENVGIPGIPLTLPETFALSRIFWGTLDEKEPCDEFTLW